MQFSWSTLRQFQTLSSCWGTLPIFRTTMCKPSMTVWCMKCFGKSHLQLSICSRWRSICGKSLPTRKSQDSISPRRKLYRAWERPSTKTLSSQIGLKPELGWNRGVQCLLSPTTQLQIWGRACLGLKRWCKLPEKEYSVNPRIRKSSTWKLIWTAISLFGPMRSTRHISTRLRTLRLLRWVCSCKVSLDRSRFKEFWTIILRWGSKMLN